MVLQIIPTVEATQVAHIQAATQVAHIQAATQGTLTPAVTQEILTAAAIREVLIINNVNAKVAIIEIIMANVLDIGSALIVSFMYENFVKIIIF